MTEEKQCQVCWSLVFLGDEHCIVHHVDGDLFCCILCGAAAEKAGWCISV